MKTGFWRKGITLMVALLLATSCKPTQIETTPAHLVSITISPSNPSIAPGTTTQLSALGKYDNNAQLNLTTLVVWTSTAPAVATVNSKGIVTAAAAGSTTIIATYQDMTGSAAVTASVPTAITVSPAAPTIASGTAIQFSARGTLENGATQDLSAYVTWSSSDTGIASINSNGLAQAAASTTGSTTITASFGTVIGTTTLTSSTVASLSITPAVATIVLGATQQFTAVGVLASGGTHTQDLTAYALWSSSSPTVATVGNTAGSQGLAVSVGTGTTSITASFGGLVSNSAALTVKAAVLNSITVTPSGPSLAKGMTQQFIATGTHSDGTIRDITASATWVSSNTQVAIVSNATGSKGVATTLSQGTTLVTASFGGITSQAITLTVTAPVLTSLLVTPSNPSIAIGGGVQFTATGVLSDGTTEDLTSTASWTSSNTFVATISMFQGSQGFATASEYGNYDDHCHIRECLR